MNIYEKIKHECDRQNIPISRLERLSGLGNGTIGGWKNPKSAPKVDSLMKVSATLGVPIAWLIKEEKENEN